MAGVRQRLSETLVGFEGRWVAVDRKTNVVRAAAADPDDLVRHLKRDGIKNVDVLRVRGVDEPELVGWG